MHMSPCWIQNNTGHHLTDWLPSTTHSRWRALCLLNCRRGTAHCPRVIIQSNAVVKTDTRTCLLGCVEWGEGRGGRRDRWVQWLANTKQIATVAEAHYITTALHLQVCVSCKLELNIKGYNSEFEFEHIIRSSKIRPSFNIPSAVKLLSDKSLTYHSCTVSAVNIPCGKGMCFQDLTENVMWD